MSISELARQVGMAKSGISRYFNKTRGFPLDRADDFAKVLGTTSEFLLGVQPISKDNKILEIYNQLEPTRQEKVLDYAEVQLEEQNKVRSIFEVREDSEDYIID
ncbi:helix-turn-helix transcriptional regulator, partial [Streptococcus suis]